MSPADFASRSQVAARLIYDEILAQVIRLTTGMYIESEDGRVKILPNGIQTLNPDDEVTFSVATDGGDVFVKGSLWAGELILPVEAI